MFYLLVAGSRDSLGKVHTSRLPSVGDWLQADPVQKPPIREPAVMRQTCTAAFLMSYGRDSATCYI